LRITSLELLVQTLLVFLLQMLLFCGDASSSFSQQLVLMQQELLLELHLLLVPQLLALLA